jgi:hypothetical protein
LKAGAKLELQADVYIPHDLQGVYTWVGVVIYDSKTTKYVGEPLKLATSGWLRQRVVHQVPPGDGSYDCVFMVNLIAEQSLSGINEVAQFDNVVLRRLDTASNR